jgi:hypothetical protein
MLTQARFEFRHALLKGGDPFKRGLELKLLLVHDLHERTHHGLDARGCAGPIGFGDPQSLRQLIHTHESASDSSPCQLSRSSQGRERLHLKRKRRAGR